MRLLFTTPLFLLFKILVVCPVQSDSHRSNDATNEALRRATDQFAFDIYKNLAKSSDAPNLFLSPLSINAALFLIYLGSANDTQEELNRALSLKNVSATSSEVGKAYSSVTSLLRGDNTTSEKRNYQLKLANRICLNQNLNVKQEFMNVVSDTEIGKYDFANDAEKSRQLANKWVSDMTNGKIPNLLAPGQIDATTMLLIMNAIYFKADWQYQFEKSNTGEMKFFTKKDTAIRAQMMRMKKRMFYAESAELKAKFLEIPYKSEELSMLVLLPNEVDGIQKIEQNITPEMWQGLQDITDMHMVALAFPRFKLEESYDLMVPLQKLGITKLFGEANLTGMLENAPAVGVTAAVHKAFVEVNEEGTEAAAATGIVFSRSAVMVDPSEIKEFKADHPFLFAIRHNPTNLILFMGRVGDPVGTSS